jgi:hypothetical protein
MHKPKGSSLVMIWLFSSFWVKITSGENQLGISFGFRDGTYFIFFNPGYAGIG